MDMTATAAGAAAQAAAVPTSNVVWIAFGAIVIGIILFDLFWMRDAQPKFRTALSLTVTYVAIAIGFGIWLTYAYGTQTGALYATTYILELSLSVDNLLVIALIFSHFSIPDHLRRRVLFWGVVGAIVMRGIMILLGAAAIERFEWLLIVFALLLLATGAKILLTSDSGPEVPSGRFLRFATKFLRIDPELSGEKFFVKRSYPVGSTPRIYATRLFLALLMIEMADLIFAVDSIPAALAISTDPLIVYTSNIFAVVGLRAMYFTVAGGLQSLVYLRPALGLVLIFIGGKIGYEQLIGHVPEFLALGVTVTLIGGGILLSTLKARRDAAKAESEPKQLDGPDRPVEARDAG
jgi:tellurite resistance protein TerC